MSNSLLLLLYQAKLPWGLLRRVCDLAQVAAVSRCVATACLLNNGEFAGQQQRRGRGGAQDEHPSLPEAISADMADFLLACFQKDPVRRPGAAALLRHRWVRHHRASLRASWSRTAGLKARGGRSDAHVCVSAVVERILQARAAGRGFAWQLAKRLCWHSAVLSASTSQDGDLLVSCT